MKKKVNKEKIKEISKESVKVTKKEIKSSLDIRCGKGHILYLI